jgi:hypothetical protein
LSQKSRDKRYKNPGAKFLKCRKKITKIWEQKLQKSENKNYKNLGTNFFLTKIRETKLQKI